MLSGNRCRYRRGRGDCRSQARRGKHRPEVDHHWQSGQAGLVQPVRLRSAGRGRAQDRTSCIQSEVHSQAVRQAERPGQQEVRRQPGCHRGWRSSPGSPPSWRASLASSWPVRDRAKLRQVRLPQVRQEDHLRQGRREAEPSGRTRLVLRREEEEVHRPSCRDQQGPDLRKAKRHPWEGRQVHQIHQVRPDRGDRTCRPSEEVRPGSGEEHCRRSSRVIDSPRIRGSSCRDSRSGLVPFKVEVGRATAERRAVHGVERRDGRLCIDVFSTEVTVATLQATAALTRESKNSINLTSGRFSLG